MGLSNLQAPKAWDVVPCLAEETRRSLSKRCWRLSHVMESCPRVPQGEPATWGRGWAVCLFVGYFPLQSLALRCPMIPRPMIPPPSCPAQVKKRAAYTMTSLPFRGCHLLEWPAFLQLLECRYELRYCWGIVEETSWDLPVLYVLSVSIFPKGAFPCCKNVAKHCQHVSCTAP